MLNIAAQTTTTKEQPFSLAVPTSQVQNLKKGDLLLEATAGSIKKVYVVREIKPSPMVNIMLRITLVNTCDGEVSEVDLSKTTPVLMIRPTANDLPVTDD